MALSQLVFAPIPKLCLHPSDEDTLVPATRSQYWLTGILGLLSIGSVVYTIQDGEDSLPNYVQEREVESQKSIDSLSVDMNRLFSSIGDWPAFCEDPYAYIHGQALQGSFEITLKDQASQEELAGLTQIERDALLRCDYDRNHPQSAQARLCLTVKEEGPTQRSSWFTSSHLFEVNVQFRGAGRGLVRDCADLASGPVELQSYFSAYAGDDKVLEIKRISGGLRLPLHLRASL